VNIKNLSKKLAIVAILLWISSLALPAIITYSEKHVLHGIGILFLGIFSLNAAWYSNILFLLAAYKVRKGAASSLVFAGLSIVLAFDTFRYSRVLTDEGGGTVDVFGYGPGAIIWGASLLVMLFAASQSQIEIARDKLHSQQKILKIISFLCLVSIPIYFYLIFSKYHQDHSGYINESDQRFLSTSVIKLGEPCREPTLVPLAPPLKRDLVLELNAEPKSLQRFWQTPFELLEYGISKVRYKGLDFYISDGVIEANYPTEQPGAALSISLQQRNTGFIKLIEYETGNSIKRASDYTWSYVDGRKTCPFQSPKQTPKYITFESLGIPEHKVYDLSSSYYSNRYKYSHHKPIEASTELVSRYNAKNYRNLELSVESNNQCSRYSFLADIYNDNPYLKKLGAAFKVNDNVKFIPSSVFYGELHCINDVAYFARHGLGSNELILKKIKFPEARVIWNKKINIEGKYRKLITVTIEDDGLYLDVLNRRNSLVTLKLSDD
jgi:hypothetical protein